MLAEPPDNSSWKSWREKGREGQRERGREGEGERERGRERERERGKKGGFPMQQFSEGTDSY